MGTASIAAPTTKSSAVRAILLGGATVGTLDILSAIVSYGVEYGTSPIRIFQSVASGWLGKASYQGGMKSAALGLLTHYFIATMVVVVYWIASRKLQFLIDHAVICGLFYGLVVYFVMQHVVIPLSAIHNISPMSWAKAISGPLGHPFLVGLPAALMIKKYSR